jgi:hypothetical protein
MTRPQLLELIEDQERWLALSIDDQVLAKQRYVEIQREEYLLQRSIAAEKLRLKAVEKHAIAMEEQLQQRRDEIRADWDDAWENERASIEEAELGNQITKDDDASPIGVVLGLIGLLSLLGPGIFWFGQLLLDAANEDRWLTWPDALAYSMGVGKQLEQIGFCVENRWSCADDLTLHWYIFWPLVISILLCFLTVFGMSQANKAAES